MINVASVVGLRANAGQANYAASKAGLIAFTRTVAVEVARRGVTVNAVAPGLIETEMTAGIEGPIAEAIPARRPGTPRGGRRLRRLPRLRRRLLRDRNNADRRRRNDRLTRKEKERMPETKSATKEQIEERVIEALVEFGEERDEHQALDAKFEDLDVDSLDLVELAQIIEDEYGVEVQDSDLDKIETVGDVIDAGLAAPGVSRDVVITGLGAVTPLGVGARTLIERWSAGESGIADGVARCSDFEPTDLLSRREARRADRFTQLALVAADEALAQAGWSEAPPYDGDRRRLRDRHRDRRDRDDRGPAHRDARARAGRDVAALRAADDAQRRRRRGRDAPRPQGRVLRHRLRLRGRAPRRSAPGCGWSSAATSPPASSAAPRPG